MKYLSSLLRAGLSPSRGCAVIRHASDSGHPGVVPTKVENHLKDWIAVPCLTLDSGFRRNDAPFPSMRHTRRRGRELGHGVRPNCLGIEF
jgi:hypothetical protein